MELYSQAIKTDIPYVPSTAERVLTMLDLADVRKGDRCADLGSGDGRVVIAFAKIGAEAHGYEIHEGRVEVAKRNIKEANLQGTAHIHTVSFWDIDLSGFQVVTTYAVPSIMERLQLKLERELTLGTRVISNAFTFPKWTPDHTQKSVYLYTVK